MRKSLWIFFTFLSGIAVASGLIWAKNSYVLSNYRTSDRRILDFDPYQYTKKTRSSVSYFLTSLPRTIQLTIQNRKLKLDYLISCEGDLIPGHFSEFATSFFSDGTPQLIIFELQTEYIVKNTYDLSSLLNFKKTAEDDSFEIHCPPAGLALNGSSFHIAEQESDLVENLRRSDREVIVLKTKHSAFSEVFAYSMNDAKFHKIGELP